MVQSDIVVDVPVDEVLPPGDVDEIGRAHV